MPCSLAEALPAIFARARAGHRLDREAIEGFRIALGNGSLDAIAGYEWRGVFEVLADSYDREMAA